MEYPDEPTLLARGKLSTVNRERRKQIERVQSISKLLMHHANPLLQDCQKKPPEDASSLVEIEKCLKNAQDARARLVQLAAEAKELEPIAWPQ